MPRSIEDTSRTFRIRVKVLREHIEGIQGTCPDRSASSSRDFRKRVKVLRERIEIIQRCVPRSLDRLINGPSENVSKSFEDISMTSREHAEISRKRMDGPRKRVEIL
ncbi:hypothetical protein WME94_56525 [Sorangium sp. So ce429]